MQEDFNLDQLRQKIMTISGAELIRLQSFLESEIQRRKQILSEIPALTLDQIPLRVQTRMTFYSVVRRRKICNLAEVGRLTLTETLALLKPADMQSLKSLNQRCYNEVVNELARLKIPYELISLWDVKMFDDELIASNSLGVVGSSKQTPSREHADKV